MRYSGSIKRRSKILAWHTMQTSLCRWRCRFALAIFILSDTRWMLYLLFPFQRGKRGASSQTRMTGWLECDRNGLATDTTASKCYDIMPKCYDITPAWHGALQWWKSYSMTRLSDVSFQVTALGCVGGGSLDRSRLYKPANQSKNPARASNKTTGLTGVFMLLWNF